MQMCKSDPDFYFEDLTQNTSVDGLTVIDHTAFDKLGIRFSTPSDFPNILQVGDFNLDGYPDLFLPVMNKATGNLSIQLWESVPCDANKCPGLNIPNLKKQRTFEIHTSGVDELTNIEGAYASAFFDFGETVQNYHRQNNSLRLATTFICVCSCS